MNDMPTTVALIVMTLLSAAAWVMVVVRRHRGDARTEIQKAQYPLFALVSVMSIALFLYRLMFVHEGWAPLAAHVDGLVLAAALLGPTIIFLQRRSHLPGLTAFSLPTLTILLAWGICASQWTFHPFSSDSMWLTFHLGTVYVGTVSVALSAIAGSMYLHVQRRLHRKLEPPGFGRLASLEAIEKLIITAATVGFALITLALITGGIMLSSEGADASRLGNGWWHSPKIILSVAAWLLYALLINVKHATSFRGTRAAWLSIAGLVLLLATFAVVNAMSAADRSEATLLLKPQAPSPKPLAEVAR